MAEYQFQQPKTVEDEKRCVANAIPNSTQYKNKWVAHIFEEWGEARFLKVATLEPGGFFFKNMICTKFSRWKFL